jgi:hypothetical protein
MATNIAVESFSAGYEIVHGAEVMTIAQDEAEMDMEMFKSLAQRFGEPLVAYIDGLHYALKPTGAIPRFSVAVPQRNHDEPETVLIQR